MSEQWPPQQQRRQRRIPEAQEALPVPQEYASLDPEALPTQPVPSVPPDSPSAPDALPTQPMPSVGHEAPVQPMPPAPFSPLPPSAPPSVPLHDRLQRASAPQAPLPQAPSWYASEMVASPAAPVVPARVLKKSPRDGRRPLVPLLVGLVALLVLGGGGAIYLALHSGSPATGASGKTTPAATNGFTTYTDSAGIFTLQVPESWLATGNAALTAFGPAAEPGVRFEIERVEVALNGQQDAAADSFFAAAASDAGANVSNRAGPTQISMAGEQWSRYTGEITAGTTTEEVVLLAADHAGATVLIATFAPKTAFAGDDAQYFQPMLRSLNFLH